MQYTTRFAPSPTGFLHLGHAYSARQGFEAARKSGGRFFLRIEDIDHTRCRPAFEAALIDDLRFLGLSWDGVPRRQSEHRADYDAALATLNALGVLYPCFCTRTELAQAAAQRVLPLGDGIETPYAGTCRSLGQADIAERISKFIPYSLRLNLEKSLEILNNRKIDLSWQDLRKGSITATPQILGDVVLKRKDIGTSYHIAVCVDDHLQGVTLVTRGEDLFEATHIHCVLQGLLGFPTPLYDHHPLLQDDSGEKLAKRRNSPSLQSLREQGLSATDIWARLELPALYY